jgi:hypothetical protein
MTYALPQMFSRRGMNRQSLGNDASDESFRLRPGSSRIQTAFAAPAALVAEVRGAHQRQHNADARLFIDKSHVLKTVLGWTQDLAPHADFICGIDGVLRGDSGIMSCPRYAPI